MRIPKKLDSAVDKYLKIWYTVLNRELFDGHLPKSPKIGTIRCRGLRGVTCFQKRSILGIGVDARDYNPLEVLLHEMVHVYQLRVLKYDYTTMPEHDHVFWQKFRLLRRQLKLKINEIQVEK